MRKWGLHVNAGDRGRLCLCLLFRGRKEGRMKKKKKAKQQEDPLSPEARRWARTVPKEIVSIPGESCQHDTAITDTQPWGLKPLELRDGENAT